ncbi:hypothetical protein GLOIN_2v1767282 [Rhizophagus irregularis DAOM 181602=DAOM 197198]|nr:hypothetical protein GLOIN_2v1767282 [Rhizophagus irregularis DAOM 181602=DAOM 197198]
MACSKVLSGNLPELTDEILQYFKKDISTLYSCILVNRLWCRLAIPLLWEDPFSIHNQNYRCIGTYLCFLNEDSKAKFNEYGINDKLLLSNTLFNYPSFIKYLDTYKVCCSTKKWVSTSVGKGNEKLESLVYRYLFEVFIENEGILHSFEVALPTGIDHKYFYDNMDLILKNPNFTCNIKNLKLDKKFSDCLENFGFGLMSDECDGPRRQLFKLIMKYCTKIKYFDSGIPDDINIYLFIKNNQHSINYLTIEIDFHDDCAGLSSSVLQNLGQVLPSKLEYLCLTLLFNIIRKFFDLYIDVYDFIDDFNN